MRRIQTTFTDMDTGELLDVTHSVVAGNEYIETRTKKILTHQQKAILNRKDELKSHCMSLGGYIHMSYKENTKLFNTLDNANISRLLYLATYIDYNDRQENLLIKYGQGNKPTPMTRKDIQEVLLLKDTAFKSFLKNTKDNNLLYEVDGKFYIDSTYFNRGNANYDTYTRVFVDTTRDLYRGTSPKQHKLLGQALQLIPYLHFDSNVLCKNPKEQDYTKREKLTLEDIANILGVRSEKSALSKLKKALESLKVNINGQELPLFKYVPKPYDYFVLNSYVVWKGNDVAKMKENIQFYFFS